MQRKLSYEDIQKIVDGLKNADAKSRDTQISLLEDSAIVHSCIRIVHDDIEKLSRSLEKLSQSKRPPRNQPSLLKKKTSLQELYFQLVKRQNCLERDIRNKQFLQFAVLSDKIDALNKDEKKVEVGSEELMVAREKVTLDVLSNHDVLMDNLRDALRQKQLLEAKLEQSQKTAEKCDQLLIEVAGLRKKVEEQTEINKGIQNLLNKLLEFKSHPIVNNNSGKGFWGGR